MFASRTARSLVVAAATIAMLGGALAGGLVETAAAADPLLSQGKPAVASSTESAAFPASSAVDGDPGTRWSSAFSDPQWLQVDLGRFATVTQVRLRWETAYATAFQIQVSGDASSWTPIFATTTGTGGTQTLAVNGSGRYVRMFGTARATQWGYSLFEFEVFGVPVQVDPPPPPPPPGGGALGPNVLVFDPSMPAATVQSQLDSVFQAQQSNQFGAQRYALLFKPGRYPVNANLGFYTSIAGLGLTPGAVSLNGVTVDAQWFGGNATQNFWRSAENLTIDTPAGFNRWAVAQAAPFRRIDVHGDLNLAPDGFGFASGGYIADSQISGEVQPFSQQQWFTRDSRIGGNRNAVWNNVFVGVTGAPAQSFPSPPYTVVGQTPVIREKPFLYLDGGGAYQVFVPARRTNTAGVSWANGAGPGSSVPLSRFFVAHPGDSAATMNAALAGGLNLLFTPGVYHVSQTIAVTRPDTVVLGLGYATIVPDGGAVPMTVSDVDGVRLAGLLFDAGTTTSPVLLRVGPNGASAGHAADPVTIQDVFFRIGGAGPGSATTSLVVNSSDTIIDHIWAWRADHGSGVGWTTNTADTGLIVNGANVTAYGLFVEHYQKYEVIWNGNGGRTYFFQNEMPYDPPNQTAWRAGARGYAAYKVADTVTSHEAWGIGSYCFFNVNPTIVADRGFEVTTTAGVRLHDVLTVSLGGVGVIANVVNTTGAAAQGTATVPSNVVSYP
jgi:hypothetical protein